MKATFSYLSESYMIWNTTHTISRMFMLKFRIYFQQCT